MVEIAGVVTGKLDGNQVTVDITARSGDAKVLTARMPSFASRLCGPRGDPPGNPGSASQGDDPRNPEVG